MPTKLSTTDAPLVIFTFEEKFTLRGLLRDGQPWFVAADACMALSIVNVSLAVSGRPDRVDSGLDADEKGIATVNTPSGKQEMLIISESGLYSLILTSRKPEAKRFKKWVTSEVLPSIRKTGSYSMGQVAAPAFQIPNTLSGALMLAAKQAEQIEQQQAQLAIAAPKVAFVDNYVEAEGLKGFREVAKLLKANEARFRDFLIQEKIMYRLAGKLMPYKNHEVAGRFEVKAGEKNGYAYQRCYFTPKGVRWVAGEWAEYQLNQEVA